LVPISSCFVTLFRNCGSVSSSSWRFWHTLTPCCFCLSLGRHKFYDSLLHVQFLHHVHCACYKGDSHLISRIVDTDVSFSWTGSLLHATFLCVLPVGRYPKCSAFFGRELPQFWTLEVSEISHITRWYFTVVHVRIFKSTTYGSTGSAVPLPSSWVLF
jgi:hypothetical protein